jgi:uncharacterized secreted repeat protein (TIGR03808 family)
MPFDRRRVLSAGLGVGLGAGLGAATAAHAGPRHERAAALRAAFSASDLGLEPGAQRDQAAALQALIDEAANRGEPLLLPPGRYRTGALVLRPATRLVGASRTTILEHTGDGAFLSGEAADGALVEALVLDGAYRKLSSEALLSLKMSQNVTLRDLALGRSAANGITLDACAGGVFDCRISGAMQAGLLSRDATNLGILHNEIVDCANNGIQVWRTTAGEDGTLVANNRIARIRADAGGTGENGNGINVFRSGNVLVTGNRIADCAYSAIRGNAASDIQMVANSCTRAGEVALYAEFGFQGALIANNLVDSAATGVSVTNFNDGGRLAVVQGNMLRNLFRRGEEPEDKRGEGITVEADTIVTGNVIENAPTAGLVIGWGRYVREVVATNNLIRKARVGILISQDAGSGACLIANNMIAGAADGSIRAMDGSGQPTGPELAGAEGSDLAITGNLAV